MTRRRLGAITQHLRPAAEVVLAAAGGGVGLAAVSDAVLDADGVSVAGLSMRVREIYHSPQRPGFTSWCGLWTMPNDELMVSFAQATGPVDPMSRPRLTDPDIQRRLLWPPPSEQRSRDDEFDTAESEGVATYSYDMTGLDLHNVHLRETASSSGYWEKVSADAWRSPMNGATNEAQVALADGTIIRGPNLAPPAAGRMARPAHHATVRARSVQLCN